MDLAPPPPPPDGEYGADDGGLPPPPSPGPPTDGPPPPPMDGGYSMPPSSAPPSPPLVAAAPSSPPPPLGMDAPPPPPPGGDAISAAPSSPPPPMDDDAGPPPPPMDGGYSMPPSSAPPSPPLVAAAPSSPPPPLGMDAPPPPPPGGDAISAAPSSPPPPMADDAGPPPPPMDGGYSVAASSAPPSPPLVAAAPSSPPPPLGMDAPPPPPPGGDAISAAPSSPPPPIDDDTGPPPPPDAAFIDPSPDSVASPPPPPSSDGGSFDEPPPPPEDDAPPPPSAAAWAPSLATLAESHTAPPPPPPPAATTQAAVPSDAAWVAQVEPLEADDVPPPPSDVELELAQERQTSMAAGVPRNQHRASTAGDSDAGSYSAEDPFSRQYRLALEREKFMAEQRQAAVEAGLANAEALGMPLPPPASPPPPSQSPVAKPKRSPKASPTRHVAANGLLVFVSDDDDSASDEDDDLDEAAAHARAVAAMRLMQATLHGNAASATPPTQGTSLPPQQAQQQAVRGGNGGDKGEEEEEEVVAVVSSLPQRARINPNAHSPRVAASAPALGGRARAASTPVSPPKGRAMPMARPKRGFAAARRARAGSEAPSPSVLRTAWRTPAPNEFSSAGSGGGNQLPPSSPSASKIPRTYSGATVEDAPLPNSSTSARSRDIALLSSGGEGSGDADADADADVDVEEGVDAAEAALEAMQAAEAALANSPAVPRRLQRPSGDGDDGAKAGEHDNGSQPPQPEAEAKKEPEEEPPAVDDNKPILQGYLRKEGRTRGSWKRRWFVMRRRVLHYLKRPDSARAQGSISLVPTVDPPTDTCEPGAVSSLLLRTDTETYPQPFCFQLVTPSRVYALQAPSKVAMVHWMAALTAALEDLREEAEGNAKTAAATAAEAAAKRHAEEAEKKAEAARAKALQRVEKRRLDAEKAAKAAQARAAAARAKAQAEAAARKAAEDAKYPTPGSPAAEQAHAAARAIAQAVAKGQVPATGASVAPSSSGSRRGSRSSRGSSPRSDGGGRAPRVPTHGGKDDGPVELTDANRALWSMPSDIPAGVNVVVQETYGNRARGGRTGQRGGDTAVAELPVQGRRLSQYSTGLPENTGNTKKTAAYLAQLCVQWINSLKVAPPITDPAKDLTSGLLLCNLVQRVIPNCALSGVNRKPRARAPAIANIEKALAVLWKHRVSSGRIPTAQEIYKANPAKTPRLLAEVYQAFAVAQAKHQAAAILRWTNGIVSMFGAPLSCASQLAAHSDGPRSGGPPSSAGKPRRRGSRRGSHSAVSRSRAINMKDLYRDASNGIMFAYIAIFYGGNQTESGIDSRVLYRAPQTQAQQRSNLEAALRFLRAVRVRPYLRPEDLMRPTQDHDAVLVQLAVLYEELRHRSCKLPTVTDPRRMGVYMQGDTALVTGIRFRDSVVTPATEPVNGGDGPWNTNEPQSPDHRAQLQNAHGSPESSYSNGFDDRLGMGPAKDRQASPPTSAGKTQQHQESVPGGQQPSPPPPRPSPRSTIVRSLHASPPKGWTPQRSPRRRDGAPVSAADIQSFLSRRTKDNTEVLLAAIMPHIATDNAQAVAVAKTWARVRAALGAERAAVVELGGDASQVYRERQTGRGLVNGDRKKAGAPAKAAAARANASGPPPPPPPPPSDSADGAAQARADAEARAAAAQARLEAEAARQRAAEEKARAAAEAREAVLAEVRAQEALRAAALPPASVAGPPTRRELEALFAAQHAGVRPDAVMLRHLAERERHFMGVEERRGVAVVKQAFTRMLAAAKQATPAKQATRAQQQAGTSSNGGVGRQPQPPHAPRTPATASSPAPAAVDLSVPRRMQLKLRFGWRDLFFSVAEVQDASSADGRTHVLKWQAAPGTRVEGFMALSDMATVSISAPGANDDAAFQVSLRPDRVRQASHSGGLLRLNIRDTADPAGARAFAAALSRLHLSQRGSVARREA